MKTCVSDVMKQYRKYAFKVLNVRVTMHVPAYAIVILTFPPYATFPRHLQSPVVEEGCAGQVVGCC